MHLHVTNKEGVLPMTTPPQTGSLIKTRLQTQLLVTRLCLYTVTVMEQQVIVVSRSQWGAAAPKKKQNLKNSAQRVVIHHTALQGCTGLRDGVDRVTSIQRFHMTERQFDDIGYNFLVAGDGTVFEGRGWGVVGAHTKGNNHDSLGIAFMGNYNNDTPSTEAILSVKQLLQFGVSQGHLHKDFTLLGHRDLGVTECPGEKLYAALPQLRRTT